MNELNNILGSYISNSFWIKLSKDIKIFEDTSELRFQFKPSTDALFSIFVHEYWHYLVNVSTYARYSDFNITFNLAAIFSGTLTENANGLSSGNNNLSKQEIELYKNLIKLLKYQRGDTKIADGKITSVEILSYIRSKESVTLNDETIHHSFVELELNVTCMSGISKYKYILGTNAIEESLASIVERMVFDNDPPVLPYKIVEKLAVFIIQTKIPQESLLVICTLSLLTVNPSSALIDFLEYYRDKCHNEDLKDHEIIDALITSANQDYLNNINSIKKDIQSLVNHTVGRGYLHIAMQVISKIMNGYIERRNQDFLFECKPFKEGVMNKSEFAKLLSSNTPCTVVQENIGDDSEIQRDHMHEFEMFDSNTIDPENALKIYHAIQHFMIKHMEETGFKRSEDSKGRCPFFTVCGVSDRKKYSELCNEKPWQLYQLQSEYCWYSLGVSSLIGINEENI